MSSSMPIKVLQAVRAQRTLTDTSCQYAERLSIGSGSAGTAWQMSLDWEKKVLSLLGVYDVIYLHAPDSNYSRGLAI
jgi:hypothetical protein